MKIPSKPSELFDKNLWTDEFQNTLQKNDINLDPELQKKLINWEDVERDFTFPAKYQLQDSLLKSLQFTGTASLADMEKYLDTTNQLLGRAVDSGTDEFFRRFAQNPDQLDRDFLAFQGWYNNTISLKSNNFLSYNLPKWYYVTGEWDYQQLAERDNDKKEFVLVRDTSESPAYTISHYFPDHRIFLTKYGAYEIMSQWSIKKIVHDLTLEKQRSVLWSYCIGQNDNGQSFVLHVPSKDNWGKVPGYICTTLENKLRNVHAIISRWDSSLFSYTDATQNRKIWRLYIAADIKSDDIVFEDITKKYDLPLVAEYSGIQLAKEDYSNEMPYFVIQYWTDDSGVMFYQVDENGFNPQWLSIPRKYADKSDYRTAINNRDILYENGILSVDATKMWWRVYTNKIIKDNSWWEKKGVLNLFKKLLNPKR
jgi:hypothetical protein